MDNSYQDYLIINEAENIRLFLGETNENILVNSIKYIRHLSDDISCKYEASFGIKADYFKLIIMEWSKTISSKYINQDSSINSLFDHSKLEIMTDDLFTGIQTNENDLNSNMIYTINETERICDKYKLKENYFGVLLLKDVKELFIFDSIESQFYEIINESTNYIEKILKKLDNFSENNKMTCNDFDNLNLEDITEMEMI